jgi:hypothetical protein
MMGGKAWSMRVAGVVNAPAERAVAWWLHPDRVNEAERRITGGAADFTISETTTDGLRVRLVSFRDRKGWDHHHRIERHLASDGTASRTGDRFTVPMREVNEMHSPDGQRVTLRCMGQLEFAPRPDGSTEVHIEHDHTLEGGNWAIRRAIRRSDSGGQDRLMKDVVSDCIAALVTD